MRSLSEIKDSLRNQAAILNIEGVVVESLIDLMAYYAYTNEIAYSKLVRESDFATASENGRIMLSAGFMDTYNRGDLDYIDCKISVTVGSRTLKANDLAFSVGKVNFYTKDNIRLDTNPRDCRFYASKNYKKVDLTIDTMTENAFIDILDKFDWSNDVKVNDLDPCKVFDEFISGSDYFVLTLPDYDLRVYSKVQNITVSGYQYYKLTDDDVAALSKVKVQGLNITNISVVKTADRPNYSGESYDITNKVLFKSNKDLIKGILDLGLTDVGISLVSGYPVVTYYGNASDVDILTDLYHWIDDHAPYLIDPSNHDGTADLVGSNIVIPVLGLEVPTSISTVPQVINGYTVVRENDYTHISISLGSDLVLRVDASSFEYVITPKIAVRKAKEITLYMRANTVPRELLNKVGLRINIGNLIQSYLEKNSVLIIYSASYTRSGENIIDPDTNYLTLQKDEVVTNIELI